jgi:hypothetical protein
MMTKPQAQVYTLKKSMKSAMKPIEITTKLENVMTTDTPEVLPEFVYATKFATTSGVVRLNTKYLAVLSTGSLVGHTAYENLGHVWIPKKEWFVDESKANAHAREKICNALGALERKKVRLTTLLDSIPRRTSWAS